MTVNRRQFMRAAGLVGASALVAGCGDGNEMTADFPPESKWIDPGTLRPAWTSVNGLPMYSLVSTNAAPPDAPALVLVHGSGLSGKYMIPTARELTRDFRVYVPDMPGYGDSGDPGRVLTIPQLADWLAAWMPAVGAPRACLLGNSFGCQVIADLAARYPERTDCAVLQGPTTPPDERSGFWQFVRWRQNQAFNPGWLDGVTEGDYRKAGLWRLIRTFHFQITDRIEDKAPRIQVPVLVVRGEHDPITTQEFAELIVRLCPRGELAIIPEVAHTLVSVAPVPLAEVTRAFVKEHTRPGSR